MEGADESTELWMHPFNFTVDFILFRRNPSERFDGRLVNFLLKDPIPDAGQWDMVVNVIEKYGENDQ